MFTYEFQRCYCGVSVRCRQSLLELNYVDILRSIPFFKKSKEVMLVNEWVKCYCELGTLE